MQVQQRQKGNTLALVMIIIGVVALLVAFFALNYNQIMGAHKQAQTAIDAATLAAAVDMSKIVVDTPMGRVGLVDDAPCVATTDKPQLPQGQGNSQFLQDPRPIIGINTLMGTTRLDAVIGTKLGTSGITYLVGQELTRVQTASNTLSTTIHNAIAGTGTAYDKFGNAINFKTDVTAAYTANSRNLVNSNTAPVIGIADGWISSTVSGLTTNVPTPSTDTDLAANSSGTTTYQPYREYPCTPNFSTQTFQFAAVASQVALIDNATFWPFSKGAPNDLQGNPTTTPETAVQVTVAEVPQSLAKAAKSNASPATMHLVATAVAGATGSGQMPTFPTGALAISFATAGGVPDAAILPSGLSFKNVTAIMNSSAVNSSGYSNPTWPGPNDGTPQPWFQAVNGSVPADASASLQPYPFKGLTNQPTCNPSTALSYGVYDWIKSMGLRPNVMSVVNALSLNNLPNGFYTLQQRLSGSGSYTTLYPQFPISYLYDGNSNEIATNDWLPPAYADNQGKSHGLTSAMLDVSFGNVDGDRRNLTHWSNNPEAYRRQQSNVLGYVPADPVIGDQARLIAVSSGHVTTTDGNPASDLNDVYLAIKQLNDNADQTQANAWQIVENRMNQIIQQNPKMDKKSVTQKALQLEPRAFACLHNASFAVYIAWNMGKNLKTLSGIGCQEISPTHFIIGGSDFWPPSQSASIDQIKGSTTGAQGPGPVSTGQDSAAPGPKDWCAPLQNDHSQLQFYVHTTVPVIGANHNHGHSFLERPAFAVNPPPTSQNIYDKMKFIFTIVGGNGASGASSGPGSGQIQMVVGEAPFTGYSTLNGQQVYQSVHALSLTSGGSTVVYQVQAHDENANSYPNATGDLSASAPANVPAGYFADMDAAGGPSTMTGTSTNYCQKTSDPTSPSWAPNCPGMAFEWQLACPVVPTICPDCSKIPPITFHPAYTFTASTYATGSYVSGSSSSSTLVYEGCAQWDTNNGVAVYNNSTTTDITTVYNNIVDLVGSYWQVGGLMFSPNALGNYVYSGNGINVGTAPSITYYGSYQTSNTSASTVSWTTSQWIYEPHS